MLIEDSETEVLIRGAAAGDERARDVLLERHRKRLVRMVSARIDPRLAPRIDASDVVQEALADAAEKLSNYLHERPLPFYPWLHRLAAERLSQAHRRHVSVQARSVNREVVASTALACGATEHLAEVLADSGTSPSQQLIGAERRQRVRDALGRVSPNDREILVMYYLEELSFAEIGAILDITENAAKLRHLRALQRIRKLMDADDKQESP